MSAMTVAHPRWDEFCERLAGPEGCNFSADETGKVTGHCNGKDLRLARTLLAAMGLTAAEVEESCAYFARHGAYCDCEILFNVDE